MSQLTIPGDTPVTLYYEDSGGDGRPVVLIHGWPLSAASWQPQVLPLEEAGYRVVAYDRRGFGRSAQPEGGYDYDTFASDLNELLTELDLTDAVLVGFSMGGGEVARYVGTYGTDRLAGVVLAGAIPPALCVTDDNPDGAMPKEGFDDLRQQCHDDREGFLREFMTTFLSNPQGLLVSDDQFEEVLGITRQASAQALEESISAWGTDFRDDVEKIDVPALVIHGDADQNVPFEASGKRSAQIIEDADLHVVTGGPHGIGLTHAEEFNDALLRFLRKLDA